MVIDDTIALTGDLFDGDSRDDATGSVQLSNHLKYSLTAHADGLRTRPRLGLGLGLREQTPRRWGFVIRC